MCILGKSDCAQGAVQAEAGVPPSAWLGQLRAAELVVQLSHPAKGVVIGRSDLPGCVHSAHVYYALCSVS